MSSLLKTRLPGAFLQGNNCTFTVWAPLKNKMTLHITHPTDKKVDMVKDKEGYFSVTLENVKNGTRYFFMPEGEKDIPDPASYFQPEGVHKASQVIDHNSYIWNDCNWKGLPFKDLILYELHVGTMTQEGTFEAIIPLLDDLKDVGINALEIMPVTQFSGSRNWGYDGVYPFAIQNSYGGPEGLKKLVDACHQKGISVFLDVVYNHLGPEGNYFPQYGPYFTNRYCTPWGDAINYDGDWSDGVREFFYLNALYLLEYYHLDGLRLDAIHMAYDTGATHFWQLVNDKVKELQHHVGRPLHMIAESDLNSPRTINPPELGGYGFTAQWLDDFHHSLYTLVDIEGKERYYDFGLLEQLAKAYTDGFVHSGEFVKFRKRKFGVSSAGISGEKFVAFNLNHDQIGNRVKGERLCMLIDFERLKLATAALLLAPYVPMLFMGEEYADKSPFFYFVSHEDEALVEAVRKGRAEEFEGFKSEGTPPDPQDEKTFNDSKLQWNKRKEGEHAIILQLHKTLIGLRNSNPILKDFNKNNIKAFVLGQEALVLHRQNEGGREHMLCLLNFSDQEIAFTVPSYASSWTKILDTREKIWNVDGSEENTLPKDVTRNNSINILPLSAAIYLGETV